MGVSRDDVRHIAGLARLGLDDARLHPLVQELNGILAHMEVLQKVATTDVAGDDLGAAEGMPLRADEPPSVPLERSRESFAPAMRAGFFLVPRLATHEDVGEES